MDMQGDSEFFVQVPFDVSPWFCNVWMIKLVQQPYLLVFAKPIRIHGHQSAGVSCHPSPATLPLRQTCGCVKPVGCGAGLGGCPLWVHGPPPSSGVFDTLTTWGSSCTWKERWIPIGVVRSQLVGWKVRLRSYEEIGRIHHHVSRKSAGQIHPQIWERCLTRSGWSPGQHYNTKHIQKGFDTFVQNRVCQLPE